MGAASISYCRPVSSSVCERFQSHHVEHYCVKGVLLFVRSPGYFAFINGEIYEGRSCCREESQHVRVCYAAACDERGLPQIWWPLMGWSDEKYEL